VHNIYLTVELHEHRTATRRKPLYVHGHGVKGEGGGGRKKQVTPERSLAKDCRNQPRSNLPTYKVWLRALGRVATSALGHKAFHQRAILSTLCGSALVGIWLWLALYPQTMLHFWMSWFSQSVAK
jgi:hypothetical protein